ncbi:hypothetical protein [Aureimonas pseudogalii]|uniref:Uncharacterized protein n=1 Tax=Aureimonas pseudogalii TaxID=1744844 RepID=A0A7W6ECK7_9HYPH|nr:hypothetical protein [Aureimonas pseudogalii]MBB3998394.1 hypothetical protein [Aureimonas pseudogalii]
MLPTTLVLALCRRTALRRLLSLAGYLGGAIAVVYGVALFNTGPALSDVTLASGYWLCGGLFAMIGTYELRDAIRTACKPDPIES